MAWTCPTCRRTFKHTNQWHSCARVDVSAHLRNKTPAVRETFLRLQEVVEGFGEVAVDPVKTSVQFKSTSVFLSARLKRDHIELAFQLPREVKEFPVYRSVRISGGRVLHFAVIEEPDEIDADLVGWLREAYRLSTV